MTEVDKENPVSSIKKSKLNILPQNPESSLNEPAEVLGRFPSWLHRKLPKGNILWDTESIIAKSRLATVCEEAKCPNRLECWSKSTATFLVMGKVCTRKCGFCSIDHAKTPNPLEEDEPFRVAKSVKMLNLAHAVITMVARDDLEDGGANHLIKIVDAIRSECPQTTIELLTSDFNGNYNALNVIIEAKPEVFNHNIETVRRLSPRVRHKANYDRTLGILKYVKEKTKDLYIKSGLMVGLGETEEEVQQTINDLFLSGCDIITIGQYLQPERHKLRVQSFVHPQQFKKYEEYGLSLGLKYMYCGPFVRSSYNAGKLLKKL